MCGESLLNQGGPSSTPVSKSFVGILAMQCLASWGGRRTSLCQGSHLDRGSHLGLMRGRFGVRDLALLSRWRTSPEDRVRHQYRSYTDQGTNKNPPNKKQYLQARFASLRFALHILFSGRGNVEDSKTCEDVQSEASEETWVLAVATAASAAEKLLRGRRGQPAASQRGEIESVSIRDREMEHTAFPTEKGVHLSWQSGK